MPAPANSRNDAAICVIAKTLSRRFVPPLMRMLPLVKPKPRDGSLAGRRGRNASRTEAVSANPQKAGVQGQIERADGETGGVPRQHAHHRLRNGNADERAGRTEDEALGEERSPQRAGARAERRADGEFGFTAHRARQNQVGHVRACDHEDERRCRQQHPQHRPRTLGNLIAEQDSADAELGRRRIRLGVLPDHGGVDRFQLRARGLEIDAGREAPEQLCHPMLTPGHHRCRQVMGAGDHIGDELGFRRIRH